MKSTRKILLAVGLLVVASSAFLFLHGTSGRSVDRTGTAPTKVGNEAATGSRDEISMADVLRMASEARQHMALHLDDYTARFVKQERNPDGQLGEETAFEMKMQTRLRGDTEEAPMRVYLNYVAPQNLVGREVIWAQDLNAGKMVVHEVGLLLGMKRIWLDPQGMIAMQGQRYPISEIGMVRLVEKLMERGEKDRNNPNLHVTMTRDHPVGQVLTQLIRVQRTEPSDEPDDFSLAEIAIDPERQLILQYRSFGWPQDGGDPPLLESYTYHDVKINVGLTQEDFSPDNPNYNFPAF